MPISMSFLMKLFILVSLIISVFHSYLNILFGVLSNGISKLTWSPMKKFGQFGLNHAGGFVCNCVQLHVTMSYVHKQQ